MSLGTNVRVRLDGLRQVFTEAGFKDDVEKFTDQLVKYGVEKEASFYAGPASGDGKILITYKNSKGTGYLMFTEYGTLKDILSDNQVAGISTQAARYIIGSVFGASELRTGITDSEKNPYDTILFGGIAAASGCFIDGKACDLQPVRFAKLETERSKASAEEKAKTELERRTREENEKQIAEFTRRGDLVWEKIRVLIRLSREENSFFNGINLKVLTGIMDSGQSHRSVRSLADAEAYYTGAKKIFHEMIGNSADEAVYNRPEDLPGCVVHKRFYSLEEPHCTSHATVSGASQRIYIDVKCRDIDYDEDHLIALGSGGTCDYDGIGLGMASKFWYMD